MADLNLQSARYFSNGGYSTLEVIVNGKPVRFDRHNRNSLSEDGYISLGIEFSDDASIPEIDIPAKPEIGRGAMRLRGFTTDPQIQKLFRQFVADVDGGNFSEKKISIV